jgi:RNA polymerase sigma factor (TIGR02999 family)
MVEQRHVDWKTRAHFFGAAAEVMRRILVDHARRHNAGKRGDGMPTMPIQDVRDTAAPDGIPILALDLALQKLAEFDRALARIVELRAFGGLTIEEAACVLDVSPSTAKTEWRVAKAWLGRELGLDSHP